ncbi:secretion protein HlyD family protein [Anaerovibrio sp. JC8]|uniref:HlyD family secretion protein n=1 Tax=Anaerovibrio sp. JC8 TaxID=1240085 RepID=UPI000A0E7260|nr:HlyD family efflux transporter periplasmic adaptor subunit [Anaerovibrio sp. JC8]ORU01271.1 secretion protein HlyD family protein [Anaerovibrio sp. JC8]
MAEIDVTDKAKLVIKYGLAGVLGLALLCSSLVWYILYCAGNLDIYDAKVAGKMVGARAGAPGSVAEIMVHNGDKVKAGDVIARINVTVTEEQLQQMQQTLELSEKNLAQIRQGVMVQRPRVVQSGGGASSAEIANAKSKLDQMNRLYEMGAISGSQRDEAEAQYQAALSQGSGSTSVTYENTYQPPNEEAVRRAEIRVNQARLALEQARESSSATEITAPVDGVVYLNGIETGSDIKAGDVVAYVGNDNDIWVEAYLNPSESDYALPGQLVSFFVDRKRYEGTIVEVMPPLADEEKETNSEAGYSSPYPAGKVVVKIAIPAEAREAIHFGDQVDIRFSK